MCRNLTSQKVSKLKPLRSNVILCSDENPQEEHFDLFALLRYPSSPPHHVCALSARTIRCTQSKQEPVPTHAATHLITDSNGIQAVRHPHLVSVLDIERLSRGGYMSHNAFIPLQTDAATGGLLHCGSLGDVEQAADQELPVGAVLAHLGPHGKRLTKGTMKHYVQYDRVFWVHLYHEPIKNEHKTCQFREVACLWL